MTCCYYLGGPQLRAPGVALQLPHGTAPGRRRALLALNQDQPGPVRRDLLRPGIRLPGDHQRLHTDGRRRERRLLQPQDARVEKAEEGAEAAAAAGAGGAAAAEDGD